MAESPITAVEIISSDLRRTVTFYRALGADLPDPAAQDLESHLECDIGSLRLMIDTEETMLSFSTDTWSGSSGRITLAAACNSPAEVDQRHDELAALGGGSHVAPFDAFWGQRFATVLDPDGVRIDLYADEPSSK